MKKSHKPRRATQKKPKPKDSSKPQSVALARRDSQGLASQAPTQIVPAVSAVPSVLKTVQSLEQVRRFVSKCLNVDLQRREAKLKNGEKLPQAEKKKLEVDWGTIPGVNKPFLLQPGAEKFCFWLNIRPKYFNREVNFDNASPTNGHMEIISQVRFYLKATGEEVFEGPECSCSTLEDNYRYRFQERDPKKPQPSQLEREELKALGMGRSRKKDEWKGGRKVGEIWVWLDRVENSNIFNERNKVRQIGQKRALVKGVRNMGAMSEIFVTNPEEWDIPEEVNEGPEVDERYTEGGRRIVPDEPVSEAEQRYDEREKKAIGKLTKEQQEVLNAKMHKVSEVAPREAGATGAEVAQATQEAAPEMILSYKALPDGTWEISGPKEVLSANKDLLGPLWNGKSVVCREAKQLGQLIRQFELRNVSFREHGILREPGQ